MLPNLWAQGPRKHNWPQLGHHEHTLGGIKSLLLRNEELMKVTISILGWVTLANVSSTSGSSSSTPRGRSFALSWHPASTSSLRPGRRPALSTATLLCQSHPSRGQDCTRWLVHLPPSPCSAERFHRELQSHRNCTSWFGLPQKLRLRQGTLRTRLTWEVMPRNRAGAGGNSAGGVGGGQEHSALDEQVSTGDRGALPHLGGPWGRFRMAME